MRDLRNNHSSMRPSTLNSSSVNGAASSAELADKACEACRADAPRLSDAEIQQLHQSVPMWQVDKRGAAPLLIREFIFKNFAIALAFTNGVGALAESANHHPVLLVEWGKVRVEWWTHKINGLHNNDFILAARTDRLYERFDKSDKQTR